MADIFIIMGVSGSGKSTIGEQLALRLDAPFYDGDSYHPLVNIEKMSSGIPLDDTDRAPWLNKLAEILKGHNDKGTPAVLACSALKLRYRETLRISPHVRFIYLAGEFDQIWERISSRGSHYMKADMLQSQFDALELPGASEAFKVSIDQAIEEILKSIETNFKINEKIEKTTKGKKMEEKADIGMIGLAVMGQNLVLNMNDHGFKVVAYDYYLEAVDKFMEGSGKRTDVIGVRSLVDLVSGLKRPRKIMMMIKAGSPVDSLIEKLIPLLDKGDIIIDGGNSHYPDSTRRHKMLAEKGILFIGTGVSGGEEGARLGPSIMPGGSAEAWPYVKDIFQAISAKVEDGSPCCEWVGDEGAGHFVKMVHNGIEYGDMQLICEAYDLMQHGLGMNADEMSCVFTEWNRGKLDSYLIEITSKILAYRDGDADGVPLVDKILDSAGQKGTGKWTAVSALDTGVPLTLIGEAVFSRFLSSLKEERIEAEKVLGSDKPLFSGDKKELIADLEEALFASKVVSYAQGYMLMRSVSDEFEWNLAYGNIALMWRGGCIIRAAFLDDIKAALELNPDLNNLLLAPFFTKAVKSAEAAWRRVIGTAVTLGIPVPAMSSALAFYDGYRRGRLPANLLQAQRDFFGAHTYERTDKPRGEFFHTNWQG